MRRRESRRRDIGRRKRRRRMRRGRKGRRGIR